MQRVVLLVIRKLDLGIKIHGLDGSYFLDGFACSLEKEGWKILKARNFGSKIKTSLTYGKILSTEWIRQKSKFISWSRRFNRARRVRKNLEKFIYFREILDMCNPLKVIACVPDPMLCLAAEMRGIETVEISHAFGIPEQGEGYTKKEFMAKNHRIKPKKIITFDGITYASIKKNSGIKTFLCEKLATPFPHKCKSKKNKKKILVTCQWGYGGEDSRLAGILPNKIICEEILFLIKKYPSWQWYVKLHPVQLTGEFSREYLKIAERVFADFKNVQWKSPSLLPLENLLSNVGLHITMHSSSTFEALRAGIKTIALCPALRPGGFLSNYWENLCRDKVLFKINPKNLEQAIYQHYGKQISSKIINKYFSKHAMSPTAILVA